MVRHQHFIFVIWKPDILVAAASSLDYLLAEADSFNLPALVF